MNTPLCAVNASRSAVSAGRTGGHVGLGALGLASAFVALIACTRGTVAIPAFGRDPASIAHATASSDGTLASSPTPLPSSTPTPSPVGTATPPPLVVAPTRPRTADGAVPSTVLANLDAIAREMPRPHRDGCHGAPPLSRRCHYANIHAKTTIVLFGDSHALAWFPAVERVARDMGWRLINVTRSRCPPAKLRSFDRTTGKILWSCLSWRESAVRRIRELRPKVVLVAGSRGFVAVDSSGRTLTGTAKEAAWKSGMAWTLARLTPRVGRAIILADTPNSRFMSPAGCLRNNQRHTLRCATSVADAISYGWLNVEAGAALSGKAGFIDAELWICPTRPCPAIVAGRLVHRNRGHLTVSFPRSQWRRLERAILRELR